MVSLNVGKDIITDTIWRHMAPYPGWSPWWKGRGQKSSKGKAHLKSRKLVLSEGEGRDQEMRRPQTEYAFITLKGYHIWGDSPKENWEECPMRGTLRYTQKLRKCIRIFRKWERHLRRLACKNSKEGKSKRWRLEANKEKAHVNQAMVQNLQCRKWKDAEEG